MQTPRRRPGLTRSLAFGAPAMHYHCHLRGPPASRDLRSPVRDENRRSSAATRVRDPRRSTKSGSGLSPPPTLKIVGSSAAICVWSLGSPMILARGRSKIRSAFLRISVVACRRNNGHLGWVDLGWTLWPGTCGRSVQLAGTERDRPLRRLRWSHPGSLEGQAQAASVVTLRQPLGGLSLPRWLPGP
jgi:hypothetical protein